MYDLDINESSDLANFTQNQNLINECLNILNLTSTLDDIKSLELLYNKHQNNYLLQIINQLKQYNLLN